MENENHKKKAKILFSLFLVLTLLPLMSAIVLNEDITIKSNGLNTQITFSNPISDNDATASYIEWGETYIYFENLIFEYNDDSYLCTTLNITESNLILDTQDMTDYCSCTDCGGGGGGGGSSGGSVVTTGDPVEPVTSVEITITENLSSQDVFKFDYDITNWTKGQINEIEIFVYDINQKLIDAENVEIILDEEVISKQISRFDTGKYLGKFKLEESIDEVNMKIKVTKGDEILEKSLLITFAEKSKFTKLLDFLKNPYVIVAIILLALALFFIMTRILF